MSVAKVHGSGTPPPPHPTTLSPPQRLVFKSVTLSLAAMANVSVVVILFFLVFAILGVQLFSGLLHR